MSLLKFHWSKIAAKQVEYRTLLHSVFQNNRMNSLPTMMIINWAAQYWSNRLVGTKSASKPNFPSEWTFLSEPQLRYLAQLNFHLSKPNIKCCYSLTGDTQQWFLLSFLTDAFWLRLIANYAFSFCTSTQIGVLLPGGLKVAKSIPWVKSFRFVKVLALWH